jgi:hypothetical protein
MSQPPSRAGDDLPPHKRLESVGRTCERLLCVRFMPLSQAVQPTNNGDGEAALPPGMTQALQPNTRGCLMAQTGDSSTTMNHREKVLREALVRLQSGGRAQAPQGERTLQSQLQAVTAPPPRLELGLPCPPADPTPACMRGGATKLTPRVRLVAYAKAPPSECEPVDAAPPDDLTSLQPRSKLSLTTPHGKGTGGDGCLARLGVGAQVRVQHSSLAQPPRD